MAELYKPSQGGGEAKALNVMEFWTSDISAGEFFLDFSWLGLFLVIGTYLRSQVKLLQVYMIPANLIAGLTGLILGVNLLGWVDLASERLGIYVYHLLALLFIALGLRSPGRRAGLSSLKVGIIFICVYLVQAILGLLIAFLLIYTLFPDLFAGIGLLAPLAFGMNPGIAYSIGQNWVQYGFTDGGIVGLTMSAAGFVVAYTAGIRIVHSGIKKGKAHFIRSEDEIQDDVRIGVYTRPQPNSSEKITTPAENIESLTLHLGIIGLTFILTYMVVSLLGKGLILIGAENEVSTLWSFHFIIAAVVALFVRKVADYSRVSRVIDDTTMTRFSNLFMDFMIVASVAAISLVVVARYWIPLLGITIAVFFATWFVVRVMTVRAFSEFWLERFSAIFGNMTGTLQSALVLLRMTDPEMKSPVSYNLVYGSGFSLMMGFPLLILINAPVHYFDDYTQGFWAVLFALLLYLILLIVIWQFMNRRGEP